MVYDLPENKKKKGFFTRKVEEYKMEYKKKRDFNRSLKEKERESYNDARLKEAENYGKRRARYESSEKLKMLKNRKKGYTFQGIAGPSKTHSPLGNVGVGNYLIGDSKKSNKKMKRRDAFDFRI